MRRTSVLAAVATGLVGGLVGGLLAGCSGGGTDEASPSPTARVDDGPEPDSTLEPLARGPLDELLDAVSDVSTESPEAQLARLQRSEEIVAACMLDEGFEYLPTDWGPILAAQREREAGWGEAPVEPQDPVADAAAYGYGFSAYSPTQDAEPVDGLVLDPNAERVAAMSSAEERAWYLALWGPGQGEAYLEGLEPYDWTKYGCLGRAGNETDAGSQKAFDDSAWSGLRDEIWQLRDTVEDDERLVDARQGWATCMTDAGYPGYSYPREPMIEMSQRSAEIWEEASAGVQLDLSTNDYLTDPAYLEQQAELARLHAELAPIEIELAVADATCRVEVDYDRRVAETWLARQDEYYAAHRADLEAWLAAFEEYQAAAG